MGFRYYKSVKLGKGIRLNLSKTGVGISAGVPGARYSAHSSGRRVQTVGVPGTGFYYRKDTYARKGARPKPVAPPASRPRRPGLFAPKSEKAFYRGLLAYSSGDRTTALAALNEARSADGRSTAIPLFVALSLLGLDRPGEAEPFLRSVVSSDTPLPDQLMRKYVASSFLRVQVTPSVAADVPMDRAGAALMLAEVLQLLDRTREAVELLETLGSETGDRVVALSLADLYEAERDWSAIVRVTEGFDANDSDLGLQLLILRLKALRENGDLESARTTAKDALRFRKRDPSLLRAVRYERALLYETLGNKALARKDLERVYDEDPGFADVAVRLQRPIPPGEADGSMTGQTPPIPAPPPPMPPAPGDHKGARLGLVGWASRHRLATSGLALIILLAAIGSMQSDEGHPALVGAGPSQFGSTPTPNAITTVVVPEVVGLRRTKAVERLERKGFDVVVAHAFSKRPKDTVLHQSLASGSRAERGNRVEVVVAKPYPRVPSVLGRHIPSARHLLLARGYDVVIRKRISDQPAGTIISMTPAPGSEVLPGHRIVLVVAKTAPAPVSSCNPNYSGQCLEPNASDYDCAGGSGDGPLYVYGTVQVVGYDEYGLDADNDGIGCE